MVENDGLSNADRAQAATIAERLRDIGEQLDDLAFSVLRDAAEEGTERPVADKRLTQARRSVEKAAQVLESLSGD
jgi:phosphosulfolactate synthase (CoM biosynthesis protein A)